MELGYISHGFEYYGSVGDHYSMIDTLTNDATPFARPPEEDIKWVSVEDAPEVVRNHLDPCYPPPVSRLAPCND